MNRPLRVLFFVEGFSDIRFVVGLSQICDLTMAVPASRFAESGLDQRVAESSAKVLVHQIPGGRLGFQFRSLGYLWKHSRNFDVILSQELLRGSLNANLVGKLRRVPIVTITAISPIEYFLCRRERRQIGWLKARFGEAVIRTLMTINGRLTSGNLVGGDYLRGVSLKYCPRTEIGFYYGVDHLLFRPADEAERAELRQRHQLPPTKFIVLLSSRMSHEKDPETVLRAVSLARAQGLDAVVLNLGGGFAEFLQLAKTLALPEAEQWVLGRPAAHPMKELADFYRTADVLAQASLAEGLGLSPLEGLACGTPAAATAVGGMAGHLEPYARMTPRRDHQAMAEQLLWIAAHRDEARAQALRGREYVIREWSRERAFSELLKTLESVHLAHSNRYQSEA